MPGIELKTGACDGGVVVALCGELDITGAAGAEVAITALMIPGQCVVIDMSALDSWIAPRCAFCWRCSGWPAAPAAM